MSGDVRCLSCNSSNGPAARFCRRCGKPLEAEAGVTAGSLADPAEPATATRAHVSTEEPFDDRRLFRELCLLCGLPLLVSIVYAVVVRIGGLSALADTLATAAVAAIALVGAALSFDQVRAALRWPRARDWLATALVALGAAPLLALAFWLLQQLGFPLFDDYQAPYVLDGWPPWVAYVNVALVTPVFEELLFRGLLQPKLELAVGARDAWIVQAAVFAAEHLSPVMLVTHFGMGLAFGWVRRRSGSLLPGILLHSAWNAWVLWSAARG